MTLKDLKDIIEDEINNEGDKEFHLFDCHGYVIESPEFGFGLRGEQEFTFFRESAKLGDEN